MAKTYMLRIITPEDSLYDGPCESLVVPGVEGSLGVLAGHAPMLAELTLGEVMVRTPDQTLHLVIYGGMLEINRDEVIVLSDGGTWGHHLDVREIESRIRELETGMAMVTPETREWDFQQVELQRLLLELKAARRPSL